MANGISVQSPSARLAVGFVAGFLATLIFHQITLAVLWQIGLAPFGPYSMAPTWPFGVPAVLSLAFWGGVWGIVFALVHRRFPAGAGYWVAAFVFGAVVPSLVALLLVVPLKGGAVGAGWRPGIWLFAAIVNGAWGLGTGVFLALGERLLGRGR